jgi:hypothetical protein
MNCSSEKRCQTSHLHFVGDWTRKSACHSEPKGTSTHLQQKLRTGELTLPKSLSYTHSSMHAHTNDWAPRRPPPPTHSMRL